jgi:chloramphenicol-sensitive protein RarD
MNKGIIYGLGAYIIWGFLPLFWKALQEVPAIEILSHRMVWSLVFVLILLLLQNKWQWVVTAVRSPRILLTFFTTACILALNWFVYIWAVNAGYIVETSLGYFINPLVNVLLGVIFLSERLRPGQAAAIMLALSGVLYLTYSYGALPWISLTLAFSFGFYGLLRKTASLNSLEGLSLETALLFLPALAYLLYVGVTGQGAFLAYARPATNLLLPLAGVATAMPLLLFAGAARRVTLTTLGILQYTAPTIQFLIGVLVYGESFSRDRMIGFSLIWLALLIYSLEGVVSGRRAVQGR